MGASTYQRVESPCVINKHESKGAKNATNSERYAKQINSGKCHLHQLKLSCTDTNMALQKLSTGLEIQLHMCALNPQRWSHPLIHWTITSMNSMPYLHTCSNMLTYLCSDKISFTYTSQRLIMAEASVIAKAT